MGAGLSPREMTVHGLGEREVGLRVASTYGSGGAMTPPSLQAVHPVSIPTAAKWAWGARAIPAEESFLDPATPAAPARVGDVVLVRIEKLGYHASLTVDDNRKVRIYPGDLVIGVLGNRYATDAYEAEVDGRAELSLLTAAGMVGTIRSSHREMARSTAVSFVGSVVDRHGTPVNLKDRLFRPRAAETSRAGPLVVVVGTSMNAGKTTVVSQTVHGASQQGLRVAACKLTGSVSNRDVDEMRSAGAISVVDFSDFGFPSTYLAAPGELSQLWREVLDRSGQERPDLTVMEIADGVLERETAMVLRDPEFRLRVRGVILAADCPLSALAAAAELEQLGYPVLGVSGALTSSPLYIREFEGRSALPVLRSTGVGEELADRVVEVLAAPPAAPERSPTVPPARAPRPATSGP